MSQNRPLVIGFGVLLTLVGVLWILQGLDVLGQSGGMNGERIWIVIGAIVALAGASMLVTGLRLGKRP